jgi:hypothetical protein
MDSMTCFLQDWEDWGWTLIQNAEMFKSLAFQLRQQSTPANFEKVKAHSGEEGNEGTDELAKQGALEAELGELDLAIEPAFDVQGARVVAATQKLLNQAILDSQPTPTRRCTKHNMRKAEQALQSGSYEAKPRAAIWKGMRDKDICKNIGQFLFQTAHESQKIGSYRKNIPGYKDRVRCTVCGSENESMEHILIHCPRLVERKTIWRLAKTLCNAQGGPHVWPNINLGLIVACGAIQLEPDAANDQPKGKRRCTAKCASHFLWIILLESVQLIWVLWCKRVIQEKSHSPTKVEARWCNKVQVQLCMDRTHAFKVLHTERLQRLVCDMWHSTVRLAPGGRGHTQGDWASDLGVLVGIRRPIPPPVCQRGDW